MRKKIVAGNWKMNKNLTEGLNLINEIKSKVSITDSQKKLIVIPPYILLSKVSDLIEGSSIELGAQNVHHEQNGAYTGEISAEMLQSINVNYCLVGHSERRIYQKESNEQLLQKVKQLLEVSIQPIFCVGESLLEREDNKAFDVVSEQLKAIFELSPEEFSNVIIAYEPVWAIGTGKTATAEQAQEIHAFIRKVLSEKYGDLAQEISILYGGSCKPDNAEELFSKEDVDGGLIGGASLEASSFISIFKAL